MADTITIPINKHLPDVPSDLGTYASKIAGVALTVAAAATFAYLIWGGINWITAGGDAKKIEAAKERLTGAIIGLAIVAVSWALYLILDGFFGLGIAGKSSSSTTTQQSTSGGNTTAGISFVCISTDTCNKYCPDQDYATVRNTAMKCGTGKVGCACVNKTNPKVNPCPTGLTCN